MTREVHSPSDPAVPSMMELFRSEFPPETREPDERIYQELLGQFRLPFRFLVAEDPDVVGFVRFVRLKDTKTSFVIHIAVHPDHRGRGIGIQLLNAACPEGETILAEVEPGEPLGWWTAQGTRILTRTYTQPALRPDTDPVPFLLVTRGAVDEPRTTIENFYREAWQLPPSHPFVGRALQGVEL